MSQQRKTPTLIDVRGPRFSATLTVIVLAIALATQNAWVLAFQAVVFAIGAIRGPQFTPYAFIFKKFVKPRLKSEATFEDVRPPQFAQLVGFLFAASAMLAYLLGAESLGFVIISFALAAAFLNAGFNYCLGCEVYLLIARAKSAVASRKNREDSYNLPSL